MGIASCSSLVQGMLTIITGGDLETGIRGKRASRPTIFLTQTLLSCEALASGTDCPLNALRSVYSPFIFPLGKQPG
jgi:hypothetical protein